ncbi:MAG: hypothetical protein K2K57_02340 [Oscillospiraceae bacterium]|nr:hypothetical protein [Oscillospiraceae bacterium]
MEFEFLAMILSGGIFFIIGAAITAVSIKFVIDARNGREVTATVVDVIESRRRGRKGRMRTFYTPVYEYYDGELKTYTSRVATTAKKVIGSEETLYISEKDEVIEKENTYMFLIIGIVFAAVGAFFIIGTVYAMQR